MVKKKLGLRATINEDKDNKTALDKVAITKDIHEEAKFIWNELQYLDLYEFIAFVPESKQYFMPISQYQENSFANVIESIFSLFVANAELAINLLEFQSLKDFLSILDALKTKKSIPIDLEHINIGLIDINKTLSSFIETESQHDGSRLIS